MVTLLLGEGVPFFEDTEFARVLLKHGQCNVLLPAKRVTGSVQFEQFD
jgi:hypothetical protein